MNELALFAGAGGGILGGKLLGWRTVCAVELEPYAASVLVARQNDGILAPFPIWDDVCTFDGKPWRGIADVVSGGFPCQDISVAGKGAGLAGERSGLWREFARIIGEVQPRYAFIENSPMLTVRGLDVVLCDLAKMGYDAEWGVLSAADVGAPHLRERIWILATNTSEQRCDNRRDNWQERHFQTNQRFAAQSKSKRQRWECGISKIGADVANADNEGLQGAQRKRVFREKGRAEPARYSSAWVKTESPVLGVANGMADYVDMLKAIGNGQVPRVAATAFQLLRERNKMLLKSVGY